MGKTRTARFTAVVQKAGRPETFLLWQDPKKDSNFQNVLRQNRVMTVLREPRGKEHGEIGFKRSKAASYLIFPKALKGFEGKRIVGIKYDQLAPARPMGKPVKPAKTGQPSKPKPPPPAAKSSQSFQVTLRVTAVGEETYVVDARNRSEAGRAAMEAAGQKTPDLAKARITRRISKVRNA